MGTSGFDYSRVVVVIVGQRIIYFCLIITFAGHNADDIAETVIMNGESVLTWLMDNMNSFNDNPVGIYIVYIQKREERAKITTVL